MRKREKVLYWNYPTMSYIKVLWMPYYWKIGIDPDTNPYSMLISLGPIHFSVTHRGTVEKTIQG